MKSFNRSAITVLGTEEFLKWVKKVRPELNSWDLASLNHHPSVYMVEVEDQNCWGDCFSKYFEKIFKSEVSEYLYSDEERPQASLELFKLWFTYEYHELIYDLCDRKLEVFDE